ncbi:MetQ/NlpA family ABC transporter substrate-binding protein [Campylobacter sp. faydin G-140]|uniref:MetQ/NlpA family ABC transporter substrate-binding protein n=1 Tax=Campylobacter anatolicus TaxID=2829105 RepID=UPI001B8EB21C|nr:MetQ/NlpA family ABC transporter substrate-binding protein [Campylobacter anatolicus]MBR8462814.1 MetQ/NlpA family ABC transporter substrate-binding protein [Campylobacter anatolicus]MBR8465924.1 MetQ/NlpA family ABC transporter substrate-binding protein [Campylobacter anatolicus]
MKKFTSILLGIFIALNLYAKSDEKTIIVGVSPVPHAEILEFVKPKLKEQGYELIISEINDYSIPNIATQNGDLDANFFQHLPYLEEQNKNRNLTLVKTTAVHVEPLGFYSKKVKSIDELKDGARVAIAYDPSNGNRGLRILEKAGLISIDKNVKFATPHDITSNPKNLKFIELEGAQIPRTLDEVDLAAISTNFVLDIGLDPAKDSLVIEDAQSPYANIIVTRSGNENSPKIKALNAAVTSQEVKEFILNRYKGAVIPAF